MIKVLYSNLTTRDVSPSKIDFSWSPSTDNVGVAGYKIYRDEKEISSTKGTSYSDTGLQPGFSYSYYIRAFDAAGNLSQKSSYLTEFTQNSTTVKAVDTQAPTTPANFKVTPISEKRIDLSWSQSSDNVGVTYYKIFRDDKPMFNVNTLKATDIYNLAPNTAYSYHIIACDMAGNCSTRTPSVTEWTLSASKAGTVIKPNLDTQAPSYPPNLVIRSVTTNQIEISWSPSTDNVGVTGYIIYRNNAEISRTTGTSYRDSGLSAGTDYSYNVKAYDAAGNQSYMSNSVTEWTLANQSAAPVTNNQKDTSAPSAPNNVVARSVSTSRIDISWSASTDNVGVMGYKVIRDGNEIASVTGTSFSDNGLQPGSSYSYYIVAYDLAGNLSQRSSYVTEFTQNPPAVINNVVTPDTQAPSYPPNLNIRAISSSQLEISWSPSTDNVGVTGYIIYRNNAEISRTTGTSYRDSGLSPGTDYSYNVKAYDATRKLINGGTNGLEDCAARFPRACKVLGVVAP
jgi:chitodextrinase